LQFSRLALILSLHITCVRSLKPRSVPLLGKDIFNGNWAIMSFPTAYTAFAPLVKFRQFRLLVLNPGSGDDALSGTLSTVNLDYAPSYDALSYEWGQPELICRIQINDDCMIHITQSLYHALRNLRHESSTQKKRNIWADGICINQLNTSEREQQVALMGTIYSNAIRVITYVGPEGDDSSAAIVFAEQVCRVVDLEMANLPPVKDTRWQALKLLLLRRWVCFHLFRGTLCHIIILPSPNL